MIFFRPTDDFLDWLHAHAAGRRVVDLGAGDGWLLHRLWKHCSRTEDLGIDLRAPYTERKLAELHDASSDLDLAQLRILPLDALEAPLVTEPGMLLVFARPCHSDWIAQTVARMHRDAEILYISKPGSHEADLHGVRACTQVDKGYAREARHHNDAWRTVKLDLPFEIGEADEEVWVIQPKNPDAKGRCQFLVETTEEQHVGDMVIEDVTKRWWSRWAPHAYDGRPACINEAGAGFTPKHPHFIDCSFLGYDQEPDLSRTTDYDRFVEIAAEVTEPHAQSLCGWLSRKGIFHRCAYAEHIRYAHYVLGMGSDELEEAGWMRSGGGAWSGHFTNDDDGPSLEQTIWLRVHDPENPWIEDLDEEIGALVAPQEGP